MKWELHCGRLLLLLLLLLPTCLTAAYAQSSASSQQSVESLRTQLQEVEAKQAELQSRARQLDEDLRPENIERSLAAVGSTHPEDLREQRRQQLEKEKQSVQSQLDQLAASHARLEAAIVTAEGAAYRESAGVEANGSQTRTIAKTNQTVSQSRTRRQPHSRRARAHRVRTKRRS